MHREKQVYGVFQHLVNLHSSVAKIGQPLLYVPATKGACFAAYPVRERVDIAATVDPCTK